MEIYAAILGIIHGFTVDFMRISSCLLQVVLQVVISFIVEAFLLETSHRKKKKNRNIEAGPIEEDADCIEGGSHSNSASLQFLTLLFSHLIQMTTTRKR